MAESTEFASADASGRQDKATTREAVGLFTGIADLENAIEELKLHGFDRSDMSVLAEKQATGRDGGTEDMQSLEDDPDVKRMGIVGSASIGDAEGVLLALPIYIGAIAAGLIVAVTDSRLSTAFGAAALGGLAGAGIGFLLVWLVERRRRRYIRGQVERGGILFWVATKNEKQEQAAKEILSRYSARDVHIHDI